MGTKLMNCVNINIFKLTFTTKKRFLTYFDQKIVKNTKNIIIWYLAEFYLKYFCKTVRMLSYTAHKCNIHINKPKKVIK